MNRKFLTVTTILLFFLNLSLWGQSSRNDRLTILQLKIFQDSYPDLTFRKEYDIDMKDWKITVTTEDNRTQEFYWCNGSMLPLEEVANKSKYWSLLYNYPLELVDPKDLSQEEKENIRNFGSSDNRKNGAGTPMFFFTFLYQSNSKKELESNLKSIFFLGKTTRVHKRMVEPLKRVEEQILNLSEVLPEVKTFVQEIRSTDSYFWRIIDGTNRLSFHSLGIAMDILPTSQHGKEIFWGWTKQKDPKNWMLTPLSHRWMPPDGVIRIFENNGFIWGGKWIIYDNMHFEYHPELIEYSREKRRKQS